MDAVSNKLICVMLKSELSVAANYHANERYQYITCGLHSLLNFNEFQHVIEDGSDLSILYSFTGDNIFITQALCDFGLFIAVVYYL